MGVIAFPCINIRLITYTNCINVEHLECYDTDKQLGPTENYAMQLFIHAPSRTN